MASKTITPVDSYKNSKKIIDEQHQHIMQLLRDNCNRSLQSFNQDPHPDYIACSPQWLFGEYYITMSTSAMRSYISLLETELQTAGYHTIITNNNLYIYVDYNQFKEHANMHRRGFYVGVVMGFVGCIVTLAFATFGLVLYYF